MSRADNASAAQSMTGLAVGDHVKVRDALDRWHHRKVVGFGGWNFPCVLVCTIDEWNDTVGNGYEPDGMPWPATDVKRYEETP